MVPPAQLLSEIELRFDQDVVSARRCARDLAVVLKFELQTQTRIATAVSEIARNAFRYAKGGRVRFFISQGERPMLTVCVDDQGPGIKDLAAVLAGTYQSKTGMGIGIVGAKRLMDELSIETKLGVGTKVVLGQYLPPRSAGLSQAAVMAGLATVAKDSPFLAVRGENQDLRKALAELREREVQLARLNQELGETNRSVVELYRLLDDKAACLEQANAELAETNRGMIALYAELDEKASNLHKANESKTRFLSHVSHEFRTPLNAVISLSLLLSDRAGERWTMDQDQHVALMRKAALELIGMVNDLLDTAKVEAGKAEVHAESFLVTDLFASLKGMFNPLLSQHQGVELAFEEPASGLELWSDQGKIAQILRNFISNALKFTKAGEVRLSATRDGHGDVVFAVADTGIGMSLSGQARLFEDFSQLDGPHQNNLKGSGLGLSLSRGLAHLLGGSVAVTSQLGKGSTFTARVPQHFVAGGGPFPTAQPAPEEGHARSLKPVSLSSTAQVQTAVTALIIDDHDISRYLLADLLSELNIIPCEAPLGDDVLELARKVVPGVIFLDLMMPGKDGFKLLDELKADPETGAMPVIIHSSKELTPAEQQHLKAQASSFLPKGGATRSSALEALSAALVEAGVARVGW